MRTLLRPVHVLGARSRRPAALVPAGEAVAQANRYSLQLPMLVRGWSGAAPGSYADAALRLQTALWEVAARHDTPVTTTCCFEDVADALSRSGAIVPPARDAVVLLAGVLRAGVDGLIEDLALEADAVRVAGRVIAYLELRSRFG